MAPPPSPPPLLPLGPHIWAPGPLALALGRRRPPPLLPPSPSQRGPPGHLHLPLRPPLPRPWALAWGAPPPPKVQPRGAPPPPPPMLLLLHGLGSVCLPRMRRSPPQPFTGSRSSPELLRPTLLSPRSLLAAKFFWYTGTASGDLCCTSHGPVISCCAMRGPGASSCASVLCSAGAGVPASFGAGTRADSGSGGSYVAYTGAVATAASTASLSCRAGGVPPARHPSGP
ncbi:formin-like protein 20 [Panicum virgatum]|uniref:formin-like protein 20 n=1 Tax=Panicum virgatum TaxID=38727 RepID=UPI0019D69E6C|nr:formin-like protein 20 [Panicum virgatum]